MRAERDVRDGTGRKNGVGGIPRSDERFGIVVHAAVHIWGCITRLRSLFDVAGMGRGIAIDIECFGVVVEHVIHIRRLHVVSLVVVRRCQDRRVVVKHFIFQVPFYHAHNNQLAGWRTLVISNQGSTFLANATYDAKNKTHCY